MRGAHLMDQMTIWQQPRILARGNDRPAPLTDLAGRVRFVVFRIEVLHLPLFLFMFFDLALTQILAALWRDTPRLPLFLAVAGPEVRPYSHRASSYVRDGRTIAADPSLTPVPASGPAVSRLCRWYPRRAALAQGAPRPVPWRPKPWRPGRIGGFHNVTDCLESCRH